MQYSPVNHFTASVKPHKKHYLALVNQCMSSSHFLDFHENDNYVYAVNITKFPKKHTMIDRLDSVFDEATSSWIAMDSNNDDLLPMEDLMSSPLFCVSGNLEVGSVETHCVTPATVLSNHAQPKVGGCILETSFVPGGWDVVSRSVFLLVFS